MSLHPTLYLIPNVIEHRINSTSSSYKINISCSSFTLVCGCQVFLKMVLPSEKYLLIMI